MLSTKRKVNQLAEAATPMTVGKKEDGVEYMERTTVRSILLKPGTGEMILIHVEKGNYYKLPGGGVEPGEDHSYALARELLEEVGCIANIDVATCFAKSEEYRSDLHQISFCYVADLIKDTGRRSPTDEELDEGLTHAWVYIEDAITLMKQVEPTVELGKSVMQRDLFFIEKFAESRNHE